MPKQTKQLDKLLRDSRLRAYESLCDDMEEAIDKFGGSFPPKSFHTILKHILDSGLLRHHDIKEELKLADSTLEKWLKDPNECPSGENARVYCHQLMRLQREHYGLLASRAESDLH